MQIRFQLMFCTHMLSVIRVTFVYLKVSQVQPGLHWTIKKHSIQIVDCIFDVCTCLMLLSSHFPSQLDPGLNPPPPTHTLHALAIFIPPNFTVIRVTECEACWCWHGRDGTLRRTAEAAFLSQGQLVTLSPPKNTFLQWIGTSNVNNSAECCLPIPL